MNREIRVIIEVHTVENSDFHPRFSPGPGFFVQ
jgi:hypothetical protein